MKKKILAITGIRSEYDILYPVIDTLRRDKNFEVKLVVSGAHLSDWHGGTLKKIEKDGFKIADKIDSLLMTNRVTQRAKGVGMLIYALSQTVEREKPDFILVDGDREESIAAAIVGNYMNTLVVHMGGGDTAHGNSDDPVRFAVSKLAHIHFPIAKRYAENLLKIGEEKFRIFWAGNPSLDNIRNTPRISIRQISKCLNFNITNKGYIVLINHPLSSEKEDAYYQMKIIMESLEEFCKENNIRTIGIYPNTDPGSFDILRAIDESANSKHIRFFKTLQREMFVNLMRNAVALVGNSSMGIVEAPFYKLPAINVGERQRGRLNAGNVEFTKHDKGSIKKALRRACFDKKYRAHIKNLKNLYGDGKTAKKIKDTLLSIDTTDPKWYIKEKLC